MRELFKRHANIHSDFFFLLIKSSGKKYFYNIFLSRVRHSRRKSAAKNKCKEYWKWGHINSLTHLLLFSITWSRALTLRILFFPYDSFHNVRRRVSEWEWERNTIQQTDVKRCCCLIWWAADMHFPSYQLFSDVYSCCIFTDTSQLLWLFLQVTLKKHFLWVYLNRFLEEKNYEIKFFKSTSSNL